MSEIEKYYNGEIIVDFEEETELEKEYNKLAELYSKAVKKKIEYHKEIERLNNIINELEEWLEQEYAVVKANSIQEPNNPEWYIKWNERKNTLDKLQELKGDGSNELYNRNNK